MVEADPCSHCQPLKMISSKLACFFQQSSRSHRLRPTNEKLEQLLFLLDQGHGLWNRGGFFDAAILFRSRIACLDIGLRAVSVPIQTHQCLARRCQFSWLLTQWHLQRATAVSCQPPLGCCQGNSCLCAFFYIYYPTPPSHVNPLHGLSPFFLMARYSVSSFLVLTCARSLFIVTYKIRSSLQSVNLKSKTWIQYKEFSLNVLLPWRSVYCL